MPELKNLELRFAKAGVEHRIKFVFDLSLKSHEHIYGCIGFNRFYEAGTSTALMNALQPGDVFVDVGAHIGYFSLLASSLVGSAGRVYSFEPEQRNFDALLNHLKINNAANVLPLPWAAGSSVGIVDLYTDPENDGGHAIWDHARFHQPEARKGITRRPVFCTTLDSLFGNASPSPFKAVKIDVEGYEMEVLKGMQNLLATARIPIVIAEVNRPLLKHLGASEQAIKEFLIPRGYTAFADDPDSGQLVRVDPSQEYKTEFVFNLVFVRSEFVKTSPPDTRPVAPR
jgi:FkbM family methyltransferase